VFKKLFSPFLSLLNLSQGKEADIQMGAVVIRNLFIYCSKDNVQIMEQYSYPGSAWKRKNYGSLCHLN